MRQIASRPVLPAPFVATLLIALVGIGLSASSTFAQDGRPQPAEPAPQAAPDDNDAAVEAPAAEAAQEAEPQPPAAEPPAGNGVADTDRKPAPQGDIKLALNDVSIERVIDIIAERTGKVIMPVNLSVLKTKKITLMVEDPIPQEELLDLLFRAFLLAGVGVVERSDVIIIDLIENIASVDMSVLGPADDVMKRADKGTIVIKIFRLTSANAEDIGDRLTNYVPDYGELTVDPNSNQIVVRADIAACQRLQLMIDELDRTWVNSKTATFRLAYADAQEISENILDLFEDSGGASRSGRSVQRPSVRTPQRGGRASQPRMRGTPGPTVELRITVNILQNSVTVTAEPTVVDEIARLINDKWDLPRPAGTSKLYELEHSDPIVIRDTLQQVLGEGGGGGARAGGARRQAGAAAGRSAGVSEIFSGVYRFEALPDKNALLALCKTEESFDFLDQVIEQIDQPSSVGIPVVVPLKHASAISLTEELNALLAEAGSNVTVTRPQEGLSGEGIGQEAGGQAGGGAARAGGADAGQLSFPWQRGRQREDISPESSLIGKVRIVPITRQNALAILAPAAQRQAMLDLISDFDKPGRQVLVSAVIAEVELTDELALGLRFSSNDSILGGTLADNRIGITGEFSATSEGIFGSLFDTSVLDAGLNLNVALQALSQVTNIRILQEPLVFTADNQEAIFFDGQDVPIIVGTSVTPQGGTVDQFDRVPVGVFLNVRPRITAERDVDLEINLEISSVLEGQAQLTIVDRRETSTHVIVKNGQTIVLSGILRDEESYITRKVPVLGHIPLIGELFTSRENTLTTTELVAFITPQVVDAADENDSNFNVDFRGRLEDISRPLNEQVEDLQKQRDQIRERILPDSPTPDNGRESYERWHEERSPE